MDNLTKYLEDKRFIQWVFHPNKELEDWWSQYEASNHREKNNIQLARKILSNLKTNDKQLPQEEKIIMFSGILRQIEEKQKPETKTFSVKGLLKYAAVAIVFFAIGAILFYRHDNFNPHFYAQKAEGLISDVEAKLIRPNSEDIILSEQKSIIEYQEDGRVRVNNNLFSKSVEPVKKGTPDLNQIIIPYGKTSEIVLTDGTKVYLNAGSRLVYPEFFVDKTREVFLVGEAFFEVKHDNKHPFVVQTTDIRIKVLGTKFNISAYPSEDIIETVLTEGKVRLEQNNSGIFSEAVNLLPNQLALYNKTNSGVKIVGVDTDDYTLWKDGLFKFESTDLSRVIKKLERFYNIRFNYRDPLLGTVKITGKLELGDNREEIINRVAVAASVKIEKKGEEYYEIRN